MLLSLTCIFPGIQTYRIRPAGLGCTLFVTFALNVFVHSGMIIDHDAGFDRSLQTPENELIHLFQRLDLLSEFLYFFFVISVRHDRASVLQGYTLFRSGSGKYDRGLFSVYRVDRRLCVGDDREQVRIQNSDVFSLMSHWMVCACAYARAHVRAH